MNIELVAGLQIQNKSIAVFLRGESIDTTGLHFHQAVPPVGPGHTEIVDGSPEDAERLSLQGELGRVGAQTNFPAHPLSP